MGRYHFVYVVDCSVYMNEGIVDKVVLVEQDDIVMMVYNLDNQCFVDGIVEFIGVLEVKIENLFKFCCVDVEQMGIGQVFVQQYVEYWW